MTNDPQTTDEATDDDDYAPEYWEAMQIEADRLNGLYTGSCKPSEYEHLIAAGLLRQEWVGLGGFLGLSKLIRMTADSQTTDSEVMEAWPPKCSHE